MPIAQLADISLNYTEQGPAEGPALVLAHALGTDLSIWDQVCALLPDGLRVVRYDLRGHGASDVPGGPYTMGAMVRDAEGLLDHLGLRDVVFCGLSIGGLVAQGLAVKRLDLVRGLVLSNTAARIGTPALWDRRIDDVKSGGHDAIIAGSLARWYPRTPHTAPHVTQVIDILRATPIAGYIGAMQAIKGTDFYTPTSGLRLATLAIAGINDAATPPDLVRETADLIPGSQFEMIRKAGHLPCIDQPIYFTKTLRHFLTTTGHLP